MKTLDFSTALHTFLDEITQHYEVKNAILFGSCARGNTHAESDVDVAILLAGKTGKFVKVKLEMADIAYDILLETDIYIQALPIWEQQWQHPEIFSNPYLLNNIREEGIYLWMPKTG